jgi:glycosyltransferase involved in cell wall biosynthesis
MKISVIVPCHQNNKIVHECLDTIISQKKDNELIIACDNFDFDYREATIIKSHKKLYANGIRNFGAKHATGDYLLFLDSDIILEEKFFDKLDVFIDENKPKIVNFPTRAEKSKNVFANYKGLKESYQTDLLVKKNKENPNIKIPFYGYAVLFRKEVFEKLNGWPENNSYSFIMEHEEFQKIIYRENVKMDIAQNIKVDHYHHKNFSLFSNVFYRTGIWTTKKLRNEVEIDLFKSNQNAFISIISFITTFFVFFDIKISSYFFLFFLILDNKFIINLLTRTKIYFIFYLMVHILYFNFIFLGAIKGTLEYFLSKIKA